MIKRPLQLLDNLIVGILLVDSQNNFLYINKTASDIIGYTQEDIQNIKTWFKFSFLDSGKRSKVEKWFKENIKRERSYQNLKIATKNGETKYIDFRTKVLPDDKKLVNIIDVTEKRQRERETKKHKNRLELAVKGAHIGIWDWDIKLGEVYHNEKWVNILGYKFTERVKYKELINIIYKDDIKKFKRNIDKLIQGDIEIFEMEYRIKTVEGEWKWVRNIGSITTRDAKSQPLRAVGIYIDIDQQKKAKEKVRYLSYHDELTGLYNRRYLNNEIQRLKNSRKHPISIIIGDIDNLKYINDNYGHVLGDKYIKKIANILKETLRTEDIAARIGGDEFVILLIETDSLEAKNICDRIEHKIKIVNHEKDLPVPLSISLGTETAKNKKTHFSDIYNSADQNMYKVKNGD